MRRILRQVLAAALLLYALATPSPASAQNSSPSPSSALDQIKTMVWGTKHAWSAEQISVMEKLRDAAMHDDYALTELRHLTDNIGPRLSGSPQAQQAVDYVSSRMRSLGATVTLEKISVPHWVRGAELAEVVECRAKPPAQTKRWCSPHSAAAVPHPRTGSQPNSWWSTTGNS